MATFILGVVVFAVLFLALRHVYFNYRTGKEDCYAGSGGCKSCPGSAFCHGGAKRT